MNANTFEDAADLAALARAIQRAAVAILSGTGPQDAGVIAQDIERLASTAAGRADALVGRLAEAT